MIEDRYHDNVPCGTLTRMHCESVPSRAPSESGGAHCISLISLATAIAHSWPSCHSIVGLAPVLGTHRRHRYVCRVTEPFPVAASGEDLSPGPPYLHTARCHIQHKEYHQIYLINHSHPIHMLHRYNEATKAGNLYPSSCSRRSARVYNLLQTPAPAPASPLGVTATCCCSRYLSDPFATL